MVAEKKLLLAPLDPVHNVGLRIIDKGLMERGHKTVLLPPDSKPEEVVEAALKNQVDFILVSRTMIYGAAEILGRLVDLVEAAGLRDRTKLIVGGMTITPELAAELGFDAGYGPGTEVDEVVAYIEGTRYVPAKRTQIKVKKRLENEYSYRVFHKGIETLLKKITDDILSWAEKRTSPGIERALLREKILEIEHAQAEGKISRKKTANRLRELNTAYLDHCDKIVVDFYKSGRLPRIVRVLEAMEIRQLKKYVAQIKMTAAGRIQHVLEKPLIFAQYGTGCPIQDIAHMKAAEHWGIDGAIHIDPSWEARAEGLLDGYLTHEENGTLPTFKNLRLIKESLNPATLYQVRLHRGLNSPEKALFAGEIGADHTKTALDYGSLGGGTDPARLTVDTVYSLRTAAKYHMATQIASNNQLLCGSPIFKSIAGALVTAYLSLRLGVKPILGSLFVYSPEAMITGKMDDNYIDYNAATVYAYRRIIDAPLWGGEPIGFNTQTEDRVQSATTTALHAALSASLNVDHISIGTTDEAYARGPIALASRIDTFKAVKEAFRFLGKAKIRPRSRAQKWARETVERVEETLREAAEIGFVESLYKGTFSTRNEGGYPGRFGLNTVVQRLAHR